VKKVLIVKAGAIHFPKEPDWWVKWLLSYMVMELYRN
jgi:hypothetical protein